MSDWLEMTDEQREEANELAYAAACDRLRSIADRYPEADMSSVRQYAATEVAMDALNAQSDIDRAKRSRATRMDKRCAEYARQTQFKLSLVEGFIWDAEI